MVLFLFSLKNTLSMISKTFNCGLITPLDTFLLCVSNELVLRQLIGISGCSWCMACTSHGRVLTFIRMQCQILIFLPTNFLNQIAKKCTFPQYSTVRVHKIVQIVKRIWPIVQEENGHVSHALCFGKWETSFSLTHEALVRLHGNIQDVQTTLVSCSSSRDGERRFLRTLSSRLGSARLDNAFRRTRWNAEGELTCPPGSLLKTSFPSGCRARRGPLGQCPASFVEPATLWAAAGTFMVQTERFITFNKAHRQGANKSHFRVGSVGQVNFI